MNIDTQVPAFPTIEYTYKVEQLLFEQGTMLVKYIPNDITLTSIVYNIPIMPNMDINNLKSYLNTWAPFDKWYAQSVILSQGKALLGE